MEMETLELEGGDARVRICPQRGGLVTELVVGGQPVLFMDESTLRDPNKNVRGGIPALFPSPGKLSGDTWAWRRRSGQLKQHGFARNLPWSRVPVDEGVKLALAWPGDPNWPWPAALEIHYTLRGRTLRLEQRVTNHSAEEMPFGLGFHPYFFVPQSEKATARIPTRATRAFDNAAKQLVTLDGAGIDLTRKEVDLHLLDHGESTASLMWGTRTIRLRGSAEYRRWVIWTLAGKDFVCLEPWTCPGNALNTGEALLLLAPHESRALHLEIEVEQETP